MCALAEEVNTYLSGRVIVHILIIKSLYVQKSYLDNTSYMSEKDSCSKPFTPHSKFQGNHKQT